MALSYEDSIALALAVSQEDQVFLDADLESALALSSALHDSVLHDLKQADQLDPSLDEAIMQSLYLAEVKELEKPSLAVQMDLKLPNIKKETHMLHDAKWVIATGYSDGSAVVNATFVWAAGRDPVADIKAGHIVGQAPYCFLITLFHMNMEFFLHKGIVSPYALSTYLTKQGLPPVPGKMYIDDTILPVARHFTASIYVNIVDVANQSHPINDLPSNKVMLMVTLAIRSRHYISGLE